ncbi:T9SS type A sorting domain-containing protein [Flavobacterium salilacus subsp. salilacus]|uniref:T9SS type A sorting domain-containing protein n=1 Tax=Flavobacterium TaxID=237 RepID=UPI001074D7D9|nr:MULTISPECIES: T9SS type A sorting domain-containing protein [Flavobacterium]KAF2519166.1 T9SS type A sorting domain-containing protein [Flavobacterium salilacus subsp. salilacus]MBE1613346.1 T9SS type A sorting domain-containing protein [Flavobacterium sp. SaA2.13]
MNLKLQLKRNFVKASAILGVSLLTINTVQAQTTVSVAADAPLVAYANWFELDGTTYVNGSEWGVADLKTVVNTAENTITLHPNFSAYGNGTDPYWANGENGAKVFEGNTYIEDNSLLGQTVTFEGSTITNTLADGYEGVAFIKILSADYQLLQYLSTPLVTGENFSLTSQTATIDGAAIFQYGYSVTGVNANPTQEAALGNAVVTAETSGVDPEGTNVTVDATSTLVAYANWFELDGTTYVSGSEWAVADLKTVVNTDDNTLILHPNFSAYGDGTDPYWANGETGAKVFEGNTYVENNALIGETVTFTGSTISNTLAEGYDGIAFIKILSTDYQLLQYLTAPLVGGENFSLTSQTGTVAGAAIFQYGYSVTGVNANPNQEAALGNAVVGSEALNVKEVVKNRMVIYPNPATDVINIATDNGRVENVKIYNLLGQRVMEASPAQSTATVDVSTLTNGMYIINIVIDGKENTTRFVKK